MILSLYSFITDTYLGMKSFTARQHATAVDYRSSGKTLLKQIEHIKASLLPQGR